MKRTLLRDEQTQRAALRVVQAMVQHQILSCEQLAELVPIVTGFSGHISEDCRMLMYETLIKAYSNIL